MEGREQIGSFATFIKQNFPCSQHWEGNVSIKFLTEGYVILYLYIQNDFKT